MHEFLYGFSLVSMPLIMRPKKVFLWQENLNFKSGLRHRLDLRIQTEWQHLVYSQLLCRWAVIFEDLTCL